MRIGEKLRGRIKGISDSIQEAPVGILVATSTFFTVAGGISLIDNNHLLAGGLVCAAGLAEGLLFLKGPLAHNRVFRNKDINR